MKKTYYAFYAPYGIRTAYGPHHCPTVYTFDSREARDAWVADDPDLTRESCTAAEARKYMGI